MSVEQELLTRSESKCELCGSSTDLSVHKVAPSDGTVSHPIMVGGTCKTHIGGLSFHFIAFLLMR